MKHKHADLIMKFAEAAQESETPWDAFEWADLVNNWWPCTSEPVWSGTTKYRLKPQTKVIDWSKVNYDVVPVFTKYGKTPSYIHSYKMQALDTLVTGKKIAFCGSISPLPEGVLVDIELRNGNVGNVEAVKMRWGDVGGAEIIWFQVTGLVDGWSWSCE